MGLLSNYVATNLRLGHGNARPTRERHLPQPALQRQMVVSILFGLSYFPSFSMRSLFYFFLAGSLADYVGGWPLEHENPPKLEAEDVDENLLDDTHSFKSAIQMMDVTESRRDLKKWQAGRNY